MPPPCPSRQPPRTLDRGGSGGQTTRSADDVPLASGTQRGIHPERQAVQFGRLIPGDPRRFSPTETAPSPGASKALESSDPRLTNDSDEGFVAGIHPPAVHGGWRQRPRPGLVASVLVEL